MNETTISPPIGKVLNVFHLHYCTQLRPLVVLHLRGKRGDFITDGTWRWEIMAVETHCIRNPPLPWGFIVSSDPPAVGDDVWIEPGMDHESSPWPMERAMDLNAREPGLTRIGDWRCGDTGIVRYAEHVHRSDWRFSIANGGALTAGYGGIELPPEVFAWLIRPIVQKAVSECP